jgi:hypothetical protein
LTKIGPILEEQQPFKSMLATLLLRLGLLTSGILTGLNFYYNQTFLGFYWSDLRQI